MIAAAAPVASGGAQVTSGDFHPFVAAAGAELGIGGHAQMVRTASGATKVSIHVTGLAPGATYGSHVHAKACSDDGAGGHYMFAGPVGGDSGTPGNEIWPGPVVANKAGIANGKATVDASAGPGAVSVVIHRSTGDKEKIACADLS